VTTRAHLSPWHSPLLVVAVLLGLSLAALHGTGYAEPVGTADGTASTTDGSHSVRGASSACDDAPSSGFTDLKAAGVHAMAVDCIGGRGIANGYADGTFRPGGRVTRGQSASLVASVLVASDVALPARAGTFSDVAGSPHERSIEQLAGVGLVTGFGDGTFRAQRPVTRGQMATLLVGALQYLDDVEPTPASGGSFSDIAGSPHAVSIDWAAGTGLVAGYADGTFRPQRDVTRGQMATFLMRAMDMVIEGPSEDEPEAPSEGEPEAPSEDEPEAPSEGEPEAPSDPEDEPTPVEDSDDRHATEISHGTQLRREHTGLPADWNGTPSGQVTSSYHGQVIEHLDVDVSGTDSTAAIDVRHNNVTVRYVRVNHRNGRNGVRFAPGTTGGRVEFSEFNGHYRTEPTGNFGSIGVLVTGEADVYRNFFRGGRDGVHLRSGNSSAVENWVEDLHRHQDAHNDGLLFYGRDGATNIKFLRNRTVEGNSGGINLYAHDGHIRDVELRDNLIVGVQRGFGLRGGRTHVSRNNYQDNRDIRIEGNRFSGTFGYPNALGEGTNAGVDLSRPGNTFTNNRWVGSTTDLPARCGVHRDTCES
jgi:hypothetical protein